MTEELRWTFTKSTSVLGRLDYDWTYTQTGVVDCRADHPPDGTGGSSKPDLWLIPAAIAVRPSELPLLDAVFQKASPDVVSISGIQNALLATCTKAGCTSANAGYTVIPSRVKPGTYWLWSAFGAPCLSCTWGSITAADLAVIEITPSGAPSAVAAGGPLVTPRTNPSAPGAAGTGVLDPPAQRDDRLFLILLALMAAGLLSLVLWRALRPKVTTALTKGELLALDREAHNRDAQMTAARGHGTAGSPRPVGTTQDQPIGERILDAQQKTYEIAGKVSGADVGEAADGGAKLLEAVDTVHDFFEHMATNIAATVKPLQDQTRADIEKAHDPGQTPFDLIHQATAYDSPTGGYKMGEGLGTVGEVVKDTAAAAPQTAADKLKGKLPLE